MSKPEPAGGPTPELFFQTANAYQRSQALKAAVELDLFTAVGLGHDDPDALAERCKAAPRGMRILADYLTIQGFLTKEGTRYKLTPDSAVFLDRRSPAYMGTVLGFLHAPKFTQAFENLTGAVRKGGTVAGEAGTVSPEHPLWVDFARSMMPMMAKPAEEIGIFVRQTQPGVKKVLDIAAGHGLFGVEIGARCPEAEIVALDWPNVLTVAQELADKTGLQSRYRLLPGDAFQVEFGTGYDLVLLTNFLHHFSPAACGTLLKKIHGALAPGGRVMTLEFVPNEDRVTPPPVAEFSLIMLATTPEGDAYTFREYERMFAEAGFARTERHPVAGSIEQVLVSYRN
ncbi:methyltransferase domain-containing protein [Nitrospirales bacterium NOB]|nr:3-hydroxy-5-methyl-1-naphthoate 3-O-methyltransferase [Nitrospirota bacterium]MCE7965428.1 methyltransferase domain-containing protein [Nitrospira sp. NTP2]MCK6493054.1 methyltransferase domain-containing protein [Nitrospira sp.]MDL1889441.1 methyltransferase domain-containing protein [Nitrospirales bacterium NOB]MEB2338402.1 class I SAM-dependent methyltransferase [Nitrospirales bacterium]